MDIKQFKDEVLPHFMSRQGAQWVLRTCEQYESFISMTLSRPSATLRVFYNFDGSWEVRVIQSGKPTIVVDGMKSLQKCLEGILS